MKVLKKLLTAIFFIFLFMLLFLLILFFPLPFIPGKFEDHFELADLSRDSTFRYQRYNDWISTITRKNGITGLPYPFLISVTGYTDGASEVYLKYVGFPGRSSYSCILPKGKIDTTFNGELYEDRAEIVYQHNNAKKGNLKILFRIGPKASTNSNI